jgi:hypothetical protein
MKKLSIKQRKFLDKYLETGNMAEAAEYAGSKGKNSHNLHAAGRVLWDSLGLTISELMEEKGLSDEKLMRTLEDGLNATKVISCNVVALDKEGMKDADSMTKDFVDVDDFPTRHKYLETALKLKGHLKDKKDDQAGVTIIINAERHD